MAKKNDTTFFENKLLDFVTAKDPMLEKLQWVMDKFIEIRLPTKREQKKGFTQKLEQDTGAATESAGLIQGSEQFIFLFRRIQERGLEKVWLCVSDAHKGLQAAIRNTLPGTTWQRCKVHFMRNILAYVPQKEKEKVAAKLKLIWKAPDEKSARAMKDDFCEEYEKSFPKAVECLEEGFEDSVQFYAFEELDSRKISSTNTLERLNREIRRRSSVVGIFPSTDSYIRLITSYLLEYSEDWQTERSYMNAGSIKVQKEILFNAA